LKLTVLGSGSEGNSILISNNDESILIDAGFSGVRLAERMKQVGLDLDNVMGLLLTHEHSDHIRGAGVISRRHNIPVFATAGTFKKGKAKLGNLIEFTEISGGNEFMIGDFRIQPYDISHDAMEPVGYVVETAGAKIGVCTDSGCVTHLMRDKLKLCDALVLEMNHDPTMLLAGPYPWELKQRIRSRTGHLSNETAAELLTELWHPKLKHVFLAHLSQENNLPQLAKMAAEESLINAGCSNGDTCLHLTCQHMVSELITL